MDLDTRADPDPDSFYLQAPLRPQPTGSSGSFIGLGSDNGTWRIKPLNNHQGPEILISELLVSKLGSLIGAPVCRVEVMWIGEDHVGWEFRAPRKLEMGFAAASSEVPDVVEMNQLAHRADDDNAQRHVGVYAIRDWCLGSDDQWLYQGTANNALFSHDHGQYLGAGKIDSLDLNLNGSLSFQPSTDPAGLDRGTIESTALRLETVTEKEIEEILVRVPVSWPLASEKLRDLGGFLLRRAPFVASRLRDLS